MSPNDLEHQATLPETLTQRQREVASLVRDYVAVARELPSAGWLSRRMNISRERARQHIESLRDKVARARDRR